MLTRICGNVIFTATLEICVLTSQKAGSQDTSRSLKGRIPQGHFILLIRDTFAHLLNPVRWFFIHKSQKLETA